MDVLYDTLGEEVGGVGIKRVFGSSVPGKGTLSPSSLSETLTHPDRGVHTKAIYQHLPPPPSPPHTQTHLHPSLLYTVFRTGRRFCELPPRAGICSHGMINRSPRHARRRATRQTADLNTVTLRSLTSPLCAIRLHATYIRPAGGELCPLRLSPPLLMRVRSSATHKLI